MTKTLEALVNGVNDRMDGYTVTPLEVRKNNDLVLQGLIIGKEGEMVAPTVYVNRHLDKIEKHEMSVNEAVDDIVQMVIKSEIQVFSSTNEWIDCIFLVDKDDAKQAAEVLDEAMNRWFDDDSQIPYGDYLEREMDARGIEYEVYFRGGSDDEWS